MPDPTTADDYGVVALGADLEPGTLLAAYRSGLFPMRIEGQLAWWSPDPRGVLPFDGLVVSRSLRRSARRFEIRVDTAFTDVMKACAAPERPDGWIDESFVAAYSRLFELGWAHSFETWRNGELVGGMYGVAIARLFAGESMFHHETDASKVALMGAVDWLTEHGFALFDVQWTTDHLASLGARGVTRAHYLDLLNAALRPGVKRVRTPEERDQAG